MFTGDTLFRDSVGGVRAPGHTTYTDLRDSIMGTLMELPQETLIYPGHAAQSTVGREWQENPFIRVWRGLDPERADRCLALDWVQRRKDSRALTITRHGLRGLNDLLEIRLAPPGSI